MRILIEGWAADALSLERLRPLSGLRFVGRR
jgi:hypothetical protein